MATDAAATVHPNEDTPRIAPRPMEDMRPEWLAILAHIPGDGLKGAGFPRNVLGSIMHDPDTFGPFLEFWVTCKSKMALSVREQEIVILRMGCLYGSNYVWKHHVPVAMEFGVTGAELAAIRHSDAAAFTGERERSLLALTDELVEARTIGAGAWDAYAAVLSPRDVVDLISLVSQYVFFALVNNALQVAVEPALDNVPGLQDL